MAALTKHAPPINGGALFSYFKTHFRRTKRTVTIAYVFVFIFIAFTIFLAFTPSANPSSPWFASIFTVTAPRSRGISNSPPSSYRSHFSSVYDYFFSNSSSAGSQVVKKNETLSHKDEVLEAGGSNITVLPLGKPISVNQTLVNSTNPSKPSSGLTNQTRSDENHEKVEVLNGGNSNMTVLPLGKPPSVNQTLGNSTNPSPKPSSGVTNQTRREENHEKIQVLKGGNSSMTVLPLGKPPSVNQTLENSTNSPKPSSEIKNQTQNKDKNEEIHDKGEVSKPDNSNITSLPLGNNANPSKPSSEMTNQKQNKDQSEENHEKVEGLKAKNSSVEEGIMVKNLTDVGKKGNDDDDDLIKSLMNCDLFDGNWVRDDSYPLYKPGSCSLIDEQFDCFLNGRPDNGYYKLKWKPKGCSLPRLNGSHMLELLRGKRLVFVGDSLNRNMWESLICILRNSVKDHTKVYEENGRHHFRTEASYSFVFEDYKCTVEFFVTPFLVQEWEVVGKDGTKKETLRLDTVSHSADKYKNADVIVFNTGHWWTHEKTALGKDYYQEGSHVYSELNVLEAFRKAITTWGRWIDANVDPNKSLVFFRGYSMSHFSGGQWNSGGQCNHETDPIKNDKYLRPYPPKMAVLEKVLRNMKTRVKLLNVTTMTDYRKDGHPSIYRKLHLTDEERRSPSSFQDCSHWCLPGVPDSWNEVLYAELLVKMNQEKRA